MKGFNMYKISLLMYIYFLSFSSTVIAEEVEKLQMPDVNISDNKIKNNYGGQNINEIVNVTRIKVLNNTNQSIKIAKSKKDTSSETLANTNPNNVADGYKEMKFGMSKDEMVKRAPCSIQKFSLPITGVDVYVCDGFPFMKGTTTAYFYFIDNKLARIGISIDKNNTAAIVQSLNEKYGISNMSPEEDFKKVDRTPNFKASMSFYNNSVILIIVTDAEMKQEVILLYTVVDYDTKLINKQKKEIPKDDL